MLFITSCSVYRATRALEREDILGFYSMSDIYYGTKKQPHVIGMPWEFVNDSGRYLTLNDSPYYFFRELRGDTLKMQPQDTSQYDPLHDLMFNQTYTVVIDADTIKLKGNSNKISVFLTERDKW